VNREKRLSSCDSSVDLGGKSTREGTKVREKEEEELWVGQNGSSEVRTWDTGSRREVEGNGDPHRRGFRQNQTDGSLKINQGRTGPKCSPS
jgi:hypothetical protein